MIPTTVLNLVILGQVVLPGSEVGLEQAQERAPLIVVAEPAKYGLIFGLGATSFSSLDLKHSDILKGSVKPGGLEKVSISFSGYEILPKLGDQYVFFINEYSNHPNIVKMLPATAEDVEAVKKEIKAREKP